VTKKGNLIMSTETNKAKWSVDNVHSKINFSVKHMVIAAVTGQFKDFTIDAENFEDDITTSSVKVKINAASIDTGNNDRDNHLRSEDFFAAEKFSQITFEGSDWEKIDDEEYKLRGKLTVKEKTTDFEFNVNYGGQIIDPYGFKRSGYKIEGKLNRFDYDLRWNNLLETGGAVVGKQVKLSADIELVKKEG